MHAKGIEVVVRPMQDRDLQQAGDTFRGEASDESFYSAHLHETDQFAVVVELDGKLVGSMLYIRRESQIYIVSQI